MVGLGRMGGNMAQRLLEGGHDVTVFDLNAEAREEAVTRGATAVSSLGELKTAMTAPRAVWVMVPAGAPTEATIEQLVQALDPGDVIIDGGNSNFRQSITHANRLREAGIGFIDAGVSGGVWGLKEGYCLMVGGETQHVERLRPVLKLSLPQTDLLMLADTVLVIS